MARALAEARETIAGETVVAAGDEVATVVQATDATVVELSQSPAAAIRGANALKLARPPAAHLPRTVTPDPTVGGGSATQPPASTLARVLLFGGAAAALLAAGAVGGILMLRGRSASPPASAPAVLESASLTDVYVANQVELARSDLAVRDYASAERRAEEVLTIAAGNAGAKRVLEESREARRQIDETASEARAAFARKDIPAASLALGRVMSLDPRHPVVEELSTALRQHLRPQAEDARRRAEQARRGSELARATALPLFGRGQRLAGEAGRLFEKEDFAAAAQRYMESRDAFERAKREADDARAAIARPAPTALPATPAARVAATPLLAAPPLATPPLAAPAAAPTPTPPPAPAVLAQPDPAHASVPAPSTPTPTPARSPDAEVRRVIAEYARAMQSRDVALFRSLKPSLSAEDERRLREAFKTSKTEQVGIAIESVQIDGDRATVRATRQDVINGRPTAAVVQTFKLVRVGSTWQIQ
jgi:hypothetical protein